MSFNHIELFSGCGGLSLGLREAGFSLVMANELSPMAAETFAYNFYNENLDSLGKENKQASNTLWLSSRYDSLMKRLRENPFEYPEYEKGYSDIDLDIKQLKGKLLVGNIVEFNKYLMKHPELCNEMRLSFESKEVDLVSGGPPCQGFSMAGLREKNSDKNTLPFEFAEFVEKIQPRVVMLENVTGILRAFQDNDGQKFHAWFEIAKVFALKSYIPLCLHVNARLVGVPQNRPRFIMIAVRNDVYKELTETFQKKDEAYRALFASSEAFFMKVKEDFRNVQFGDLHYFDVNNPEHFKLYKKTFLYHLIANNEVSVKDAIDDLKINIPSSQSKYVEDLNNTFSLVENENENKINNHEYRNNTAHVRRRFRIYQVIQECGDKSVKKEVLNILRGKVLDLSDMAWTSLRKYDFLTSDGNYVIFTDKIELVSYLQGHLTKKYTQKSLDPLKPAPAALSIPDDACHYDKNELRVLTVREMARIQSFPDQFVFRSKVTTGGKMRRFEVPQYTQVGNAVPPLLGLALGRVIKDLLGRIK